MSFSKEEVIKSLKEIVHPDYQKDIVEQQIVEDLIVENNKIAFTLVFKKINDPFASAMKKVCIKALTTNLGEDIEINIEEKFPEAVKKPVQSKEIDFEGKTVIAVASGKGGVGKSTVAANIAIALSKKGKKVGLIDADIYGPSIPLMFDVESVVPEVEEVNGKTLIKPVEKYGIKILSIGFFVDPETALIWRGPMASNALTQLLKDGDWSDVDTIVVDLPPGTGDIHLTLVQKIKIDGVVIVSTPQKVAIADARKGISMFRQEKIDVPVLGLVENMSFFTPAELPDNKYFIFGKDGCNNLAKEFNVPVLGEIPLIQSIRESGDAGVPSAINDNMVSEEFMKLVDNIKEQLNSLK